MKRSIWKIAGLLLSLAMVQGAYAASTETAAGTTVSNTATVNYQVGGVDQTAVVTLVPDEFLVDTKVDLVVTADAANVTVVPNSTNEVLAFTVTNTGNATLGTALSVVPVVNGAGDDFDMFTVGIYIDNPTTGTVGSWDAGDVLYSNVGENAGDLDPYGADAITVFLVSDTPSDPTNGQLAQYTLTAQALTAGTNTVAAESTTNDATLVDVIFADAAGSTDAVEDGLHSATGAYEVVTAELVVTKSSAVIDDGLTGAEEFAIPGATVRYTISIANGGTSDAVIPDDTIVNTTDGLSDDIDDSLVTYTANSVVVGGVAIDDGTLGTVGTDTAVRVTVTDADVTVAAIDRIQVNGLTVVGGATVVITFDVTIN